MCFCFGCYVYFLFRTVHRFHEKCYSVFCAYFAILLQHQQRLSHKQSNKVESACVGVNEQASTERKLDQNDRKTIKSFPFCCLAFFLSLTTSPLCRHMKNGFSTWTRHIVKQIFIHIFFVGATKYSIFLLAFNFFSHSKAFYIEIPLHHVNLCLFRLTKMCRAETEQNVYILPKGLFMINVFRWEANTFNFGLIWILNDGSNEQSLLNCTDNVNIHIRTVAVNCKCTRECNSHEWKIKEHHKSNTWITVYKKYSYIDPIGSETVSASYSINEIPEVIFYYQHTQTHIYSIWSTLIER